MGLSVFNKTIEDIKRVTGGTIDALLKDFNEAAPTLKDLGLSVKDVKLAMGVLPEVDVTLTGTLDAIKPEKLKSLMDAHKGNTVLVSSLKALETAHNMKTLLGDIIFKGIEGRIKLGLPPKIEIDFIS